MSTMIDVSGKLGEYMLKGWVLTDRICKKCSKVPLMRSPSDNTLHFCANCDDGPAQSSSASSVSTQISLDSGSHASRASTPLTDLSEALSSPTFAPPIDTEELLRRRQQSDLASTEIGKRLLKGWAMLADECLNPGCYGIPLVRPPKAGGERDPRKECVVCHAVYIDQADSQGIERLVHMPSDPVKRPSSSIAEDDVPQPHAEPAVSADKGKERQRDPQRIAALGLYHGPTTNSDPITRNLTLKTDLAVSQDSTNAIEALQQSLKALTEKLKCLSPAHGMDVALVGQTADSISKVSQALIHVRQLEQSYR